MARRATIVDSLEASGTPFLHLDLGDFVSTQKAVEEQRSRALWDEMIRMGVRATTPGGRELAQWPAFQSFLESGEIPVVSSNLFVEEGGEKRPVGSRYLLADVGGVRLGIFGLVGTNAFTNTGVPQEVGLSFQDPTEAAREILPELREKCEITVLLSQLSRDETFALVDEVEGIDVALLGNRAAVVEKAVIRGGTVINQAGSRGQFAGMLTLVVTPEGHIAESSVSNVPLDALVAKEPETLARAQAADDESTRIRNEDLLAEKRVQVAKEGSTRYLGAETCKRCHSAEYEQWTATPHARAFASLESSEGMHGMTKTDDCARCHATGWKAAGGYVAPTARPDLRAVQCEACHGPGTEHVRTGGITRLTEAACTGCHDGVVAQDWNFAAQYELVRHR